MNNNKQSEFNNLNSLIYMEPLRSEPTRYQMIRYSTWRIYFFQELQAMASQKITQLKKHSYSWVEKYPHLITTNQEQQFYSDLLNDVKVKTYKQDIISHFICRMLYCRDSNNHAKFVQMEKSLFSIRLQRILAQDENAKKRKMLLLKKILAYFLQKNHQSFNIPLEDWNKFREKISYKADQIQYYALIPMQYGEVGMKRRFSFVRKGNVYMNIDSTTELVENLYASFLKNKLEKMRIPVQQMLNNDVQNQMNGFLSKTLQTLNTTNFDESVINNQFKLNIKNIESLWKRFFPPCMLNLNQKLKQMGHLKHEGRRQLWLFLKGCGMDVHDNQQYFRKHFAAKVSASDLKSHMYNIQHAYGLVGKRQPERPKNCRNIITGPAPKKDEHHGCPFAHWRKQDLKEYLRKNYSISEVNIEQVIRQKEENHFQVACGRLFEGVTKSQGISVIPSEITSLLAKSPHEYFQAGMEMVTYTNNKGSQKKDKKAMSIEAKSIEF